MTQTQNSEFVSLHDITQPLITKIGQMMLENRRKRYNVPATEETRRATLRMLGEKDE